MTPKLEYGIEKYASNVGLKQRNSIVYQLLLYTALRYDVVFSVILRSNRAAERPKKRHTAERCDEL